MNAFILLAVVGAALAIIERFDKEDKEVKEEDKAA